MKELASGNSTRWLWRSFRIWDTTGDFAELGVPIDFPRCLWYLQAMAQSTLQNTTSVSDAFAHCEALTRAHYENFPVGSLLIPKHLRPHIHSIYAFARTADDFADEPGMTSRERLEHLDQWKVHLDTCLTTPTEPIFIALAETIRSQNLPIQLLHDLLTAFRLDVNTNRHQTFDDLLHYCTYSANPVGRLILHLFGYRDERLAQQSDAICSALQLANFWQDIAIDFSRNRIYIPQKDLEHFGIGLNDLECQNISPKFCALLDELIKRTRTLFYKGYPLLNTVRGRLRLELRLTWLGGLEILNKIPQNNYDIFHRRPTVGKRDLPRLVFKTLLPVFWPSSPPHI